MGHSLDVAGSRSVRGVDHIGEGGKSMRTIYRCEFIYGVNQLYVLSHEGIERFSHGFWLNENMELTKGDNAKYWIPPSAIQYISKGEE